jgi:hypothetical protein
MFESYTHGNSHRVETPQRLLIQVVLALRARVLALIGNRDECACSAGETTSRLTFKTSPHNLLRRKKRTACLVLLYPWMLSDTTKGSSEIPSMT